jgi:hypothetical protein
MRTREYHWLSYRDHHNCGLAPNASPPRQEEPKLKALTIREPYATAIIAGRKPVEVRTWTTSYRGMLLIHSSNIASDQSDWPDPLPRLNPGHILGFAELWKIEEHEDFYAWHLRAPNQFFRPIPCRGSLSIWTVPLSLRELVKNEIDDALAKKFPPVIK